MKNMYTILVPLLENTNYKLFIPINIIINKGLPKVQIISAYKYKTEVSNKIKSLLKLYGILKFKQILIEFPEFTNSLINLRNYANILVEILKILLSQPHNTNKYFININSYKQRYFTKYADTNTKRQVDTIYIDSKLISQYSIPNTRVCIFKKAIRKLIYKQQSQNIVTKLQFINTYTPSVSQIILTPLPEINLNKIKILLNIKNNITIHNKNELIQDLLNLSIPRKRIIYSIKVEEIIKNIQLLMIENTQNYIVVQTCNCGKLFSTFACNCSRVQIYNYLKSLLALTNHVKEIHFYDQATNKLQKTSIDFIYNQYRSIL